MRRCCHAIAPIPLQVAGNLDSREGSLSSSTHVDSVLGPQPAKTSGGEKPAPRARETGHRGQPSSKHVTCQASRGPSLDGSGPWQA